MSVIAGDDTRSRSGSYLPITVARNDTPPTLLPRRLYDGEGESGSKHPRNEDKGGYMQITKPGQACRKCGTPVEQRKPKQKRLKPGQTYYFDWYLRCPSCGTMYMVEAAKHQVGLTAVIR